MKVAYIIPSQGQYGDNIAILKLIPHLIRMGVNPLFILPHEGQTPISYELDRLQYKYVICPAVVFNVWPSPHTFRDILGLIRRILFIYPKAYKKVLATVKDFQPDVIHTNCSFTALGYKLAKDLNIKHLWHIREYGMLDAGFKYFPTLAAFERKLKANNNYSVYITDDIYFHFGSLVTGNTVYDGVFDTLENRDVKTEDEGYFLYVGRLTEKKGVRNMLNVFLNFCKNNKSDAVLKLAGTGTEEYETMLKKIVAQSGYKDRVEFLGFRNDVYDLMSNAKALIVPSYFEAFGFITAEGMLNGCPVIGNNTAGTKIQFDNGVKFTGEEIGLRYNSDDELLEHFKTLASTPRITLMRMLQNAQRTVLHYYTSHESAKHILNIYNKITETCQ